MSFLFEKIHIGALFDLWLDDLLFWAVFFAKNGVFVSKKSPKIADFCGFAWFFVVSIHNSCEVAGEAVLSDAVDGRFSAPPCDSVKC